MPTPLYKYGLAALALLALIRPAVGQNRVSLTGMLDVPIEQISINQGLSQGMTFAITEDEAGFLWVATKDGLNRYDGNGFKVFHHDPKDPYSIAENYVTAAYVDSKNRLWVGYNSSGVDLYERSTGRFIHFGGAASVVSGLRIKCVNRIMEDPKGNIILYHNIGSRNEVIETFPRAGTIERDSIRVTSLEEIYPGLKKLLLAIDAFNFIGFSQDGTLWYVEKNNIFGISSESLAGVSQPLAVNYSSAEMDKDLFPAHAFPLHFFFDYPKDNLYFVSAQNRILKFDFVSRSFMTVMHIPMQNFIYKNDAGPLHRFFIDKKNQLWITHADHNLRINLSDGKTDLIHFNWDNTERVVRNYPVIIQIQDKSNNLWAGTSGHGLLKITSRIDQLNRVPAEGEFMWAIRIASENSSAVFDPEINKVWKNCMDQLSADFDFRGRNISLDRQGYIWIGAIHQTAGQYALLRVDPDGCTYTMMTKADADSTAIFVLPLLKDHRGEIWFGEHSIGKPFGLFHFNPLTREMQKYFFPVEAIDNEHQFISDWYVDQHDLFWLGTKQGLFVFDPGSGKWMHQYQYDPNDPESISGNYILSLCPDPREPDRFLWIGTDGSGLNKLDYGTGKFTRYSTDDYLPNNVIYGIQSDRYHNLWISTNKGLCLFNPMTLETRRFTTNDGLPGNEFNRFAFGKSKDGLLYFGGPSGAVYFDPEVFYENRSPSTVIINLLKLRNKEVVYRNADTSSPTDEFILPAPIEQCKKLVFRYDQRMITFGFAVLDFTNPDGNRYKYKMEGFNDDWIDAGSVPEATYTNLSPGTYTFQVLGCNSANVWSAAPVSMIITILPPWWGTLWFRGLVLIIIAFGIYAFYRYRLKQAFKLHHLRNRIAADLHDEIGSTLSSISLAGSVIQKKLDGGNPEVRTLLHQISDNTDNMMEAMSDIVWAVNTKNDRFDNVVNRMRAFAIEILEPKNILLHFNISPVLNELRLDMQQRKNLYLIFKEVINNAAKYAACKNVWVNIELHHSTLSFCIKDDGQGFDFPLTQRDASGTPMGGNGLYNIQKRTAELKGKIKIDSGADQGTTVDVRFPV